MRASVRRRPRLQDSRKDLSSKAHATATGARPVDASLSRSRLKTCLQAVIFRPSMTVSDMLKLGTDLAMVWHNPSSPIYIFIIQYLSACDFPPANPSTAAHTAHVSTWLLSEAGGWALVHADDDHRRHMHMRIAHDVRRTGRIGLPNPSSKVGVCKRVSPCPFPLGCRAMQWPGTHSLAPAAHSCSAGKCSAVVHAQRSFIRHGV